MYSNNFDRSNPKVSHQEMKKLLGEAKKLKNVFTSDSFSCFSEEIRKLQEVNLRLESQGDEANTILNGVVDAIESLKAFVSQSKKEEGKLNPKFNSVDLIAKKLFGFLGRLNSLKIQIESQIKTSEKCLNTNTSNLLELLREKEAKRKSKPESLKKNNVAKPQNKFIKQQSLDDARIKKIEQDYQIKKINDDIRNASAYVDLLNEEITKAEKKLTEKRLNGSPVHQKGTSKLATMINDLDCKQSEEYIEYIITIRGGNEQA